MQDPLLIYKAPRFRKDISSGISDLKKPPYSALFSYPIATYLGRGHLTSSTTPTLFIYINHTLPLVPRESPSGSFPIGLSMI